MSTVDRTPSQYRRRQAVPHVDEAGAETQRPRRRWRRRVLIATAFLLTALCLAPWLAAKLGLVGWIAARVGAGYGLQIDVGSASLGWLSGVRIDELAVRDSHGQALLSVPSIEVDRALWRLALSQSNLGVVRIEQPQIDVMLRSDGSNIEDLLATWTADSSDPADETQSSGASALPTVRVELIDGTIVLHDEVGSRDWKIEQWGLTVDAASPATAPVNVKTAALVSGGPQPGRVQAELTLPPGDASTGAGAKPSQATIQTENLPAEISDAVARRFAPGTRTAGLVTAAIQTNWQSADDGAMWTSLRGRVAVDQLALATPALGRDQLRLVHLEAPCQLEWNGRQLDVQQLAAACDLGRASFQGTLDTEQGILASLMSHAYSVDAEVDLAALTAALPETVHLRDDTEITSGVVQLELKGVPGAEGLAWLGHLETTNVVATAAGRQITWNNPILVTLAAHETPRGFVVDDLYCESEFLEVQGSGASDYVAASASFDLDKLAAEAGRFLDITSADLAGDGWAHVTWQRRLDDTFDADAEVQVEKFRLAMADAHPWLEDKLNVALAATGRMEDARPKQFDTAKLTVTGTGDQLEAWLTQPVADATAQTTWPVEMTLAGALEKWVPRLEPFLGSMADWDLRGQCQMAAEGTWSSEHVALSRGWIDVRPFHFWGSGLYIDEPQLQIQATADYQASNGSLQLTNAVLATQALVAESKQLNVAAPSDGSLQADGTVTWQGDMYRLARWLQDPAVPPTTQYWGRLQGQLDFQQDPNSIAARLSATIQDFVAASSSGQTWREPQLDLALVGDYLREKDELEIKRVAVTSQALGADLAGKIADLSATRQLELHGKMNYDFAELRPLLEPYLGANVTIAGRETRDFAIRWALGEPAETATVVATATAPPPTSSLASLWLNTSVGWSGFSAYGFQGGASQATIRIDNGMLETSLIEIPVSQGHLRVAPRVRLAPEPQELIVPGGRIIDRVQITPEMCAHALQYVAPVLAGVTTAQGNFSIDLETSRVPMDDYKRADVAGRFQVHSVEIGPGPLVQELAVLLNRPSPAKLTKESVVPFRMVDGRVYHRDLELVFPDLTIRTHGSVGLDRTLAIMAEMPVPPKWIGNNPLGDAIKGQTIRLPIGGTLERPKIDQQALAQANAQFIGSAAGSVIRGELNKQLDRLLGPK